MSEASSPKTTVTIKKYANRRLYNTATSSYVTLESLAAMVKEGIEFNVYDAKTSEDITRSVLTQIIVEEEGKSGQQNLLPIGFMRQLISFYGGNMQWLVPKYLENSIQMLANNQEQLSNYFQATFGSMFPFSSAFEEMGKQNLAMLERAMRMFSPFTATKDDTDKIPVDEPAPSVVASCVMEKPEVEKKSAQNIHPVPDAASCARASEEPKPSPATTPMPNVKSAAASISVGADDMQQKIANLQRQLAELAKKGA